MTLVQSKYWSNEETSVRKTQKDKCYDVFDERKREKRERE